MDWDRSRTGPHFIETKKTRWCPEVGEAQGDGICVLSVTQCLTLCDPMDYSLSGSSVHGIFPGRNTRVGCHFLLQGILPTQRSNLHLLHWQALLPLSPWEAQLKERTFLNYTNPTRAQDGHPMPRVFQPQLKPSSAFWRPLMSETLGKARREWLKLLLYIKQ